MVKGEHPKWHKFYRLIPYLIIILIFAGLAARTNANVNEIHKTQHRSCVSSAKNSKNFNDFLNQLISTTKTAPSLTQTDKDQRIAAYTKLLRPIPVCT
jgi:hypothetical protein